MSFGEDNFDHAPQWILPLLSPFSHQNLLMIELRRAQREAGALKQVKGYIGIVWMTDLMSSSFPAWLSCLLAHPWTFPRILSLMKPNESFFYFPQKTGSHKYWEVTSISCIPKTPIISPFNSALAFTKKNKLDFVVLMASPDASLKASATWRKFAQHCGLASRKTNESSTNKRWDTTGHFLFILIPARVFFKTALCRSMEKTSATIKKRQGDSGSPCRRPLLG